MSNIKSFPSVFVVEDRYEICLCANCNGMFIIQIDGKDYYEQNSGVLSTEKNHCKISIPQSVLDEAKHYSVLFFKSIERKTHYSAFEMPERLEFDFHPLTKKENINIYHFADVHKEYNEGVEISKYFGNDVDLFISNGDIAEVMTVSDYEDSLVFHGNVTKGEFPILFTRGNHDTRGTLAEKFSEYFPTVNGNFYYKFSIGTLKGVILDLGEDKVDSHEEYGGVEYNNIRYSTDLFTPYRAKELEYLKELSKTEKIDFVISHICPMQTTLNKGDIFDIERETYAEMDKVLYNMGAKFMICGHIHRNYILQKNSPDATVPNSIPVIVGSYKRPDGLHGTALTLQKDKVVAYFTDKNKTILEEHIIKF